MTRVIIFHNIASDPQGRSLANFDGYTPGHPLVPVFRYETKQSDPVEIADEAYRVFNVGDDPTFGTPDGRAIAYRAAKNRALSKGDVVLAGDVWLACSSGGWDTITAPEYLAREARQHGTTPLDDGDEMRDVELSTPYAVTARRHEAALSELDSTLIGEKIPHAEAVQLMEDLDRGSNLFGALGPEVRARLFAVVETPKQETWQDAHGILLSGMTTLWQALLKYTDYDVTVGPAHGPLGSPRPPWPKLPTSEQLLKAIRTQLQG